MTMEAWVRPTATGALWRTVMLKEQPGSLIYALYAGDATGRPARTSSPPPTSASAGRRHAAQCLDPSRSHLRRNHPAPVRQRCAGRHARDHGVDPRLDRRPAHRRQRHVDDEWFAGLIDEVRLYNKALTAAEIQADMAKPVSG